MDRMYRVLAFWTGIFSIMFFVGDMVEMAGLFLAQTAFFLILSFFKLSERVYLLVFSAYLVVALVGISYYTLFLMT